MSMRAFCGLVVVGAVLGLMSAATAEIRTEAIEYRHGDVLLEGFVAYDPAVDGRRPAVLVVHEWWGLDDYARRRAQQLAELGYVAFALDMYGKGVHTDDPAEAGRLAGQFRQDRALGRARAQAGLEVLRQHERVDPQRIAAIGYCFGGTVVLEMARAGMPLRGVVSFHGSLGTNQPAQPDALRASVLVLHGADDPLVPDAEVAGFMREMREAGADWQLIAYGGAVHSFTNPDADRHGIAGVAYQAQADRRSWTHMKQFLADRLER